MITLTAEQAQQIEEIVEHLLIDHPTARHHKACVEALSIIRAARAQEQEPVARVTGYHGGRCVVEPLNRALVLPIDMALYASPVQQVTRADLKAAFKEGFERAADLYAPNDGQEPYAYEVWDVQDQSFTMIYATQLKEFHWIEPENIARVLYAAPVQQAEQEPVGVVTKESLDGVVKWNGWIPREGTKLYAAPVEPVKQEPVAWMEDSIEFYASDRPSNTFTIPLYAAPVRTKDLTDDEIRAVLDKHCGDGLMAIAYSVIAADREKNKC